MIELDNLKSLINTRQYLPLAGALVQKRHSSVQFTFGQIDETIGDQLPPAARKYRLWWANPRGSHLQASSRLGVGWKVDSVDLTAETVKFVRTV